MIQSVSALRHNPSRTVAVKRNAPRDAAPPLAPLHRSSRNPILTPEKVEKIIKLPDVPGFPNGKRITGVFNPAASVVTLPGGLKKVALLFRLYDNAPKKSYIGLATSSNGADVDYIAPKPIIQPTLPEESLGVEDPRVTYFSDEKIYAVTYTGYSPKGACVCLITTPDLLDPNKYVKHGKILDSDNKDTVFFPEKINGKYVLLHRPYPDMAIAYADKMTGPWSKEKSRILLKPKPGTYRSSRLGAGAPPMKTPLGWLLPIHGAKRIEEGNIYSIGWLLLDLKNPERILYLSEEPELAPKESYEIHMKYEGPMPQLDMRIFPKGARIVFPEGMVEWKKRILVYYGAGDEFVGMAWANRNSLLERLKANLKT